MLSSYTFENFLRFQLQDKHNASFLSWRGTPQSKCKSNKKAAIITCLVVDLFACLNGIGGFYSFILLCQYIAQRFHRVVEYHQRSAEPHDFAYLFPHVWTVAMDIAHCTSIVHMMYPALAKIYFSNLLII